MKTKKSEDDIYLPNSKVKYSDIFEKSAAAITIAGANERIISSNSFTTELIGWTKEELYNRPLSSLYPKSEWRKLRKSKIREKGRIHHFETRIIKKNKELIDVDISISVLRDDNGQITYSIGIIRDITLRRKMESQIEMKEHQLEEAFEDSPLPTFVIDKNHMVIVWNNALENLTGIKRESVMGTSDAWKGFYKKKRPTLADLTISNKLGEVFKHYNGKEILESKTKKGVFQITDEFDLKKGKRIILFTAGSVKDSYGENILAIETLMDVTDQIRAEEQLEQKEEQLEEAFEDSPLPTYVIDKDYKILVWNNALENLTGVKRSSVLGTSDAWKGFYKKKQPMLADLTFSLKKDSVLKYYKGQEIRESKTKKGVFQITTELDLKKGKRIILFTASSVKDVSGENVLAVETLMDVTDQKRAEEKLAIFNKELEKQVKERTKKLNDAYKKLKKLDELKDNFLSNISHELRTPLTSMKSYNQLLLTEAFGKLVPLQKDALNIVLTSTDRLVNLVNDILDVSRFEAGKAQMHFEKHEINDLIKNVVRDFLPTLKKEKCKLISYYTNDNTIIMIDIDKIRRVFINIISNSVKYRSKKLLSIKISTEISTTKKGYIELRFKDNGVGISKENLDHIFDKFYQVDQSMTRKIGGSGLGLSIVYHIIKAHKGIVKIESEEGKGTEFIIYLPLK